MTVGRCAGCGKSDASCQKIRQHVMHCPDYLALFKTDPARCLDPEDEHRRWSREENSEEARDEARTERLTKRFADLDVQRLEQSERWSKAKDLLDD